MKTPHSITLSFALRALGTLGLVLAAMAAWAANANAYVTPAQAEHAADRGAGWFLASQEESGSLGSDWAMTALAAAGINAADARTSFPAPSAQDFYLADLQANGPGGAGTDAARGILAGHAGGIQTSRLSTSTDATRSNLVARLAELFDGEQIGAPGLLNDDVFGVLALHHAGAPQEMLRRLVDHLRARQLPNGGWSWSASASAPPDTDMTGAAVAAFCAAGFGPSDPDVGQALDLLQTLQDPATGGFEVPPEWFGVGVNTDTTAWVASGLIQCGVDPQGPAWTTGQGKTPLDYLVSLQRPDGHFDWTSEFAGGSFETFNSVRPLAGVAFSSAPPARLDGVSPSVHLAPAVADGTTVPIALVIDHGPGAGDVRMCRVDVKSGADLEELLASAAASSAPAGCVAEFAATTGAGVDLASLNGVAENPGWEWRARVDGGTAQAETSEPVGFGDLVFLQLAPKATDPGAAPKADVPPLRTSGRQRARGPRIRFLPGARWRDGSVAVRLRCPRGNGAAGCRGSLTIRFRERRGGDPVLAGSAAYGVGSGEKATVAVGATRALRQALAERSKLKLRLTAATRAADGAVRLTHVRRLLAG